MPNTVPALLRWAHRQRRQLRLLMLLAIVALFVDGFLVERSVRHLMLLHPVLLVALLGAFALTDSSDG
jgi:hypothetical protein